MKYDFFSQEWLAALHGVIEERATQLLGKDPTLSFSFCEVITNAPASLGADGGRLAWSCVIADGDIDFRREERDDVQMKAVMDYTSCLPLVQFDTRGEPERIAEFQKMMQASMVDGSLTLTLGPGGAGTMPPVHDVMARLTA